jgi:murein DD-endopeptidase MepM/ murein hydrolase activator NlpD
MNIQALTTPLLSIVLAQIPIMGMAHERIATIGLPGESSQISTGTVVFMGDIDITQQECFPVPSSVEKIQGTNKAHLVPRHNHSHQGIDLTPPASISDADAMRIPIMAWRAGFVTSVEPYWGAIRVTHEDGEKSVYGHLSSIRVKLGDIVLPCQVIGTMGNPHIRPIPIHLHFEVWSAQGLSLNPMKRLRQTPNIIVIGSTSKGFPILR